jgi:molybdopterin synthase catalytic subunit
VFENVAYLDITAAHTAGPTLVHEVGHVVSVVGPPRRDAWSILMRTFAAEVSKFDCDSPAANISVAAF